TSCSLVSNEPLRRGWFRNGNVGRRHSRNTALARQALRAYRLRRFRPSQRQWKGRPELFDVLLRQAVSNAEKAVGTGSRSSSGDAGFWSIRPFLYRWGAPL